MTNAEKLAKDTDFMNWLIQKFQCADLPCDKCPLYDKKCIGSGTGKEIREWLESEVDEDAP